MTGSPFESGVTGDASATPKLRVCHVMTADLWAGAEVQLLTLATHLQVQDDVDLHVVLFNDGVLAAELRQRGIPVTVVSEAAHGPVLIVGFLARFFSLHGIQLVHTHRYKDSLLAIVAARLAGVRHVVRTVHGLTEPARGWAWLKSVMFEAIDRLALSYFADLVIAVSGHTAETLRRAGCRAPIIQIHNGLDLSSTAAVRGRDEMRDELGIPRDAFLIGTVGRLAAVKAHDDLIHAARDLFASHPRAALVIVGGGPLAGRLESLAARLGIADRVFLPGARRDALDITAALDVFVLPSRSEGTPMALLEAMALGTPVVATAVGGVPEIVADGQSGLLVRPREPRALADACLRLAHDRGLADRLAARARQVVVTRFSRDANGDRVVHAYRAVIAAGTPGLRWIPNQPGALELGVALVRAAAVHLWTRCRRAAAIRLERWRTDRLRHDPARLTAALRSARRILIVCQGNIIRSPFAARLVADALRDRGRPSVLSAGLAAVPGRPPHPTAALIATTQRVDLSTHAASALAADVVASSDIIFVMDVAQLVALHERFPAARGRAFLLTSLAADAPLEITDPVDGDEARFRSCFEHIARAVRPIVQTLCSAPALQESSTGCALKVGP